MAFNATIDEGMHFHLHALNSPSAVDIWRILVCNPMLDALVKQPLLH